MSWQSTIALIFALVAVSVVPPSIALIAHKEQGLPTVSQSFPLEMHHLSAEEMNQHTLQLAATIKPSMK